MLLEGQFRHHRPSKLVMRGSIPFARTFARSNQKPQVNAGGRPAARSHQEAFPRFRARCVPDRPLVVPFRLAVVNTSPMAAAIASSRSLVACW